MRRPASGCSIAGVLAWTVHLTACGGSASSTQPAASIPAASAPPAAHTEQTPVPRSASEGAVDASPLAPPPNLDLARAPRIPLAEGLTMVHAVVEDSGDYEVVMRVSSPGPDRFNVSYSATVPVNGEPTELRGQRTVLTRDLQSARIYKIRWLSGRSELSRGTTALGLSTEVFDEIRNTGRSACSLSSVEQVSSAFGAFGLPSPEYEGVFERVGQGPEPVPVVVDGNREWLPAIRAKGTFEGLTGEIDAEFWFLDDRENPLALKGLLGDARMIVVRIDRPRAAGSGRLERALAADEAVDLPGVYFEFASARLRPESDAAIAEVTAVLKRHPDWKVRLEGHTDSIGGADKNLALSRARAEAVRQAIVDRRGGPASIEATGFGLTRPRERNDTAEGRARNRRVEIVRVR